MQTKFSDPKVSISREGPAPGCAALTLAASRQSSLYRTAQDQVDFEERNKNFAIVTCCLAES
jgi:hypothetical protein